MNEMPKTRAYSYIRFSTPDQMKGDSFRRQYTMAQAYALKYGLLLDDSLSLNDLGVSAYRGQNAKSGALNLFLEHIKSGDVPKGSYLLVEALDRLTRQKPLDALDTLRGIMREGIAVVTLDNETKYTAETIDNSFTQLLVTLMLFQRANEESETKSRRVRDAWGNKREMASSRPLTAICPAWLEISADRTQFQIIHERARIVQRVYRRYLEGVGQHSIAAELTKEGLRPFRGGAVWQRSYIKKLLDNPAVVGTFTPHTLEVVEGRKVRIAKEPVEGYFPSVVDLDTYERVKAMGTQRGARGLAISEGHSTANILSGLAKCPVCGATMTRVNKGARSRPYLVCTVAKAKGQCAYRQVKLETVQDAILTLRTYLFAKIPSPNEDLEMELTHANSSLEGYEDMISNAVDAIVAGDTSSALRQRISELERLRDQQQRYIDEISGKVWDTVTKRVENAVDQFCALASEERPDLAQINAVLRQLFAKAIVDYNTGYVTLHWKHADGETIDAIYTPVGHDEVVMQVPLLS